MPAILNEYVYPIALLVHGWGNTMSKYDDINGDGRNHRKNDLSALGPDDFRKIQI